MMMKLLQPTLIGLAASLLVMGAAPALAQSKAEFDELRNGLRKLPDEVAALKQAQGKGQNRNRLRLRQAYGEYAGFLVPTRVSTGAPSMGGLWRTRSARSAPPSVVMAWASAATTRSPTKTC